MTSVPFPSIDADSVGWIDESAMIEVDRVMIEDLGIVLLQMMENAGRNLARVVLDLYRPKSVAVACGSGGNGGGGMVAARHLTNAGVSVTVTTTRTPSDLSGVPAVQFEILRRMGVPHSDGLVDADVTVDAVIGYSLRGAPTGRSGDLIKTMSGRRNVVALDTPSGLNVSTGQTPGWFVSADTTMTLALPKIGMRDHPAVGRLLLADISVPVSVSNPLGGAPDFFASPILTLS
ncbi:MAG: NAD(P)H-hydrate epimerase [Acidimicrobiales bacterium]